MSDYPLWDTFLAGPVIQNRVVLYGRRHNLSIILSKANLNLQMENIILLYTIMNLTHVTFLNCFETSQPGDFQSQSIAFKVQVE